MRDKYTAPVISPDGRFEIIIEDSYDRGIHDPYTVLVERATGERIFCCEGSPRAEFVGDGLLTIHYPGYDPLGVQIDPVNRVFRTHPSEPWVPTAAWRIVESAYKRGWAACFSYKQQSQPAPFPWVAIILLLGSIVALVSLGARTFRPDAGSASLVVFVVAAVGVLFFGWLTTYSLRIWAQERKRASSEGDVSQSPRP